MTWEPVRRVCQEFGWPEPEHVASVDSTNNALVGRTGDGLLLVADEQTAGRGRLDRRWVSRPGDGLTFSIRRALPPGSAEWGWVPLLHGVAVREAIAEVTGVEAGLKWPNDVMLADGKLAGILVEGDAGAAIVGIGINLRFSGDRPDPLAVSLAEAAAAPDPGVLLAAVLKRSQQWWQRWLAAGGDAQRAGLRDRYRDECWTVGAQVRINPPDGEPFEGLGEDIDRHGALLVRSQGVLRRVLAGDVVATRHS